MQKYTDTLRITQQQINLTTSLLQVIPTFDGWDTTQLEYWLNDIKIAADKLKESHACLAKTKLHSVIHTLINEALQAMKCSDDIRDILHLKLCNTNIHNYMLCFMEIQQRNNETLAAYVHCFKTEAKRCDFNTDTTTIHIFVKGLQDAHNIAAKIYEKDPPNLIGGHKISEEAQCSTTGLQLPWHPLQSTWCQMMTGVLYVAQQVTLVTIAPMYSVITETALATLPRTIQRRFPHQEHHATMAGHTSNHVMIKTVGTDPSPLITDTAKEDALAGQDHTTDPTVVETQAPIGGNHATHHPTTAGPHDTHPPKDTLGDTLTGTHCTSTTVTHLWHATFPTGITLETIVQTKAILNPRHSPHTPHRLYHGKHWNCIHEHQPFMKVTVRRCSPFRTHNQTLLRIRHWLWSFKLLEPSSSSVEDSNEGGGWSSTHQFTVGLPSDCPTVAVYAGKRV